MKLYCQIISLIAIIIQSTFQYQIGDKIAQGYLGSMILANQTTQQNNSYVYPSGKVPDDRQFYASHSTLPLLSYIEIEYLSKKVVVQIVNRVFVLTNVAIQVTPAVFDELGIDIIENVGENGADSQYTYPQDKKIIMRLADPCDYKGNSSQKWNENTKYFSGQKVYHEGFIYVALRDIGYGKNPKESSNIVGEESWKQYSKDKSIMDDECFEKTEYYKAKTACEQDPPGQDCDQNILNNNKNINEQGCPICTCE